MNQRFIACDASRFQAKSNRFAAVDTDRTEAESTGISTRPQQGIIPSLQDGITMKPGMRIASFKLPEDLDEALNRLARTRGTSRSAIVREALELFVKGKRRSVTSLAGNLVGSVEGPPDLATNRKHMSRYGR